MFDIKEIHRLHKKKILKKKLSNIFIGLILLNLYIKKHAIL